MQTSNLNINHLLVVALLSLTFGCTSQKIWNIDNYGAVGDSTTINTEAIQQAIDACHHAGGGDVLIKNGTYLSGTIILKDNVTLRIEKGAKLVSSVNPNHFQSIDPFIDATGQYRGQCLIGAIGAKNIAIVGGGIIDGQGEMFTVANIKNTMSNLGEALIVPEMPEVDTASQNYINKDIKPSYRPFLIRLVRCENIELQDVNLRQPAAWTLHFFQCKNFKVDGISIYSHANKNNDAIDIDSSTDGVIVNTTIDSGDDAICFKTTSPIATERIVVTDCKIKSEWGAIKFGTESMGDFRDIEVRNCLIHDTRGGGIKILSVDGANISNINIENIEMQQVDMPIFIRLGERRLIYRDTERMPVGSIENIRISKINATTMPLEASRMSPPTGIFITGTPNYPIGRVKLEHIKIILPGGGVLSEKELEVPENETKYPEFTFFGEMLPAYGLYARHIDGLQLDDITFETVEADDREMIVLVDAKKD